MFPHITVAGDPHSRGLQHGRLLSARIERAVTFYLGLFERDHAAVRSLAEDYRAVIEAFDEDYVVEIDAIAAGAGLPGWQLYALNARSEIINSAVPECTAMYFAQPRVLGQNWDWAAAAEDFVALITTERPDGHRIVTFTEAGMLAKIGINNRGLGVCLNFLAAEHSPSGLPVHVLLRAILDTSSLEEAKQRVAAAGFGKACHILIGDAHGACYSHEFAGDRSYQVQSHDGVLLHTNHYVTNPEENAERITSTYERYERAQQMLDADTRRSVAAMQKILLDGSDGEQSINCPYFEAEIFSGERAGTVATIIMELQHACLHVKRGNVAQEPFVRYAT